MAPKTMTHQKVHLHDLQANAKKRGRQGRAHRPKRDTRVVLVEIEATRPVLVSAVLVSPYQATFLGLMKQEGRYNKVIK